MSPPLVTLHQVTKRYRDGQTMIDVVAPCDLSVPKGRLWALQGPSGSGKTTLLGLIGGMVTPSAGYVTFGLQNITQMREHHRCDLRRRSVGFVFQQLALIPGMSVLENVLLPLVPIRGIRSKDNDRARELLEKMGIAILHHRMPEELSGGERQRVAIARALMLDVPLLLLDEPTAHLDTRAAQDVAALLGELRNEGRTIIAATHDPRLANAACIDQVLHLEDGKLQLTSTP